MDSFDNLETLAHWADEVNYAVTIADKNCNIIYMNRRSRETFCKKGENLIGRNLMECHETLQPRPAIG